MSSFHEKPVKMRNVSKFEERGLEFGPKSTEELRYNYVVLLAPTTVHVTALQNYASGGGGGGCVTLVRSLSNVDQV